MTHSTGHLQLLDAARAVQQAATADDMDELHHEVCRLRNALVERLADTDIDAEAHEAQHRLAAHGRQRLLQFLDDVLFATHDEPDSCPCLVRSAELRSMLVRQLRLEASGMRRGLRQ
ncbi:MAG: hypothetical protein U5K30_06960 [Acidimicrobiales bacterium]|nr:hypothetical protein [Acidimicrobiales bacterium]